ncbi:GNAT family N-acetyltransferase [Flavobacterium sp.]|uniref:GNAT family N-acetyltransferase n=1 Tax=Flavobacterium sp. TaxID=239 RepID=UPI003D108934
MIRLEKFDKRDYPQLINSIKDARELMQFAGPEFTFPLTAEQIEKSLSDKNRIAFTVVAVYDDSIIGHCEICFKDNFANLGRILILDQESRGKGLGKQIVTLLLEFILEHSAQRNVELNVFDFNISAIKCYEKIGFTINPDKKFVREMDNEIWTALNMRLNLDN